MTTTLGDCELVEHLASGGMAEVWLADRIGPEGTRKRVVVKRIKTDHADDPDFETMFLDEARIALHLTHPNIVQTFELGSEDGEWFVTMELVDGPTLETLIDRQAALERPMDAAVACRIATELLAALEYAHDFVDVDGTHLQIVHRDVTPSNVMLTSAGVVKLTDFGVAKAVGRQTETQAGAVKGKFGYMAPEQIQSEDVDARTDLFAVGIVLYEALTGTPPFGTGLKGVHSALQGEYEPLADRRPDLPQEVVAVVERAMQVESDARWESARQMRRALEEACQAHGLMATLTDVERAAQGLGNAATRALERPDALAPTETLESNPGERRSRAPAFLLGLLLGVLVLLAGSSLAFMTLDDDDTDDASARDPDDSASAVAPPTVRPTDPGGALGGTGEQRGSTPRQKRRHPIGGAAEEQAARPRREDEKRREKREDAEEERREKEEKRREELEDAEEKRREKEEKHRKKEEKHRKKEEKRRKKLRPEEHRGHGEGHGRGRGPRGKVRRSR